MFCRFKSKLGIAVEPLDRLTAWYRTQCNGAWEHAFGVHIETVDNPGWLVTIDLVGTNLEGQCFPGVERMGGDEWMQCKVEANKFVGAGDPSKLSALIEAFLDWSASTQGDAGSRGVP